MKKNKLIIGILIISFLFTTITLAGRITTEYHNDSVDVVLDYHEFVKLAEASDESLEWWFSQFKSMGVQYVAIKEDTIDTMIEEGKPLQVEMVSNVMAEINWKDNYPQTLVEHLDTLENADYDVLVMTNDKETYEDVSGRLVTRYDQEKFTFIEDDDLYSIILKGTVDEALFLQERNVDQRGRVFQGNPKLVSTKLTGLGLGLDPEKMEIVQNSGLKVMPRPYQYDEDWLTEKLVYATYEEYDRYGIDPSVLIFDGEEILGYPDYIHITRNYMEENNIKIGLIERNVQREYIKQKGIDPLIESLNYTTTGVFSMPEFIQMRFAHYHYEGAEEIENTLYRAVTERNIRMIYFRPFKLDRFTYVTDIEEYEKMFDRFDTRLAKHGMSIGESSSMEPFKVRLRFQIIMGWGIVAAGILLINTIVKLKEKHNMLLMVIGAFFVMAALLVKRDLAANLLAISAAIIFASLSMIYFLAKTKAYTIEKSHLNMSKKIIRSIKVLLVASLISLVGAIYVASILASIEYFIAMRVFRGVKISQLVPFAVFIIGYLCYFGYRRKSEDHKVGIQVNDVKNLLMEDIKVIYVLAAGIVLAVGFVYIARTGHSTGLQASDLEMRMRNFLGEVLLARPRTKEFLFAFPALMVGIYVAHYKYKLFVFFAGLAAVMGQTSIINTFSHFRTPIYLSTVRTIYSLILGIVVGIIYIFMVEIGIKLFNEGKKKLKL